MVKMILNARDWIELCEEMMVELMVMMKFNLSYLSIIFILADTVLQLNFAIFQVPPTCLTKSQARRV